MGHQTDGLAEVVERTESAHEPAVRLVIDDDYTDRIAELRDAAGSSSKDYSETGFRYLQTLEGMR
ncbi:hypothetical protein ABNG03_01125 [Halorubrum sp. RMP-47]|uniref:CopG family transcriptional regulator n=1 Tax=Halorubrum miltondacostae TaxID=3076378 RepID=A0ABD5M0H6_9EURY